MSFAITGLPPTPDEVEAFETAYAADPQKAVDALADRLLASPRFGEYWARHWMDGVRFDHNVASIGYYRDWLIRAFNADLPYDRFVVAQLAGDLLPETGDSKADDDRLIAVQMHLLNLGEMDRVEGMIEVTAQQFLGVSINCAKCHDHKFDAYSQQDYYALAGIFTSTGTAGSVKADRPPVELKSRAGVKISTIVEGKKVGDTRLLIRGERGQQGPEIPRRFPAVLAGEEQTPLGKLTASSGRLELARWIASTDNPLTARVYVNRVWTWMTGVPIVGTPNDFGTMGDRPINPALLDHLAERFVKSGWSTKKLIRDIAVSRTFRQSSRPVGEVLKADPENHLLARMPVRRLDAEQLTDALYFVGGGLLFDHPSPEAKVNGPYGSPKPPGADKDALQSYRATYGIGLVPARMFDAADPDLLTVRRDESVTAPQMLFFLNNPTVHKLAAALARRAAADAGDTSGDAGRIRATYLRAFGRLPDAMEVAAAEAFIRRHGMDRFAHLLLCGSEFSYVE